MADFCTLCGRRDIDVNQIYDEQVKPTIIKEDIEKMDDESFYGCMVGICEHCGLVRIGVNNRFELLGGFYGDGSTWVIKKIGYINEDNFELTIDYVPETPLPF